jgi:DNA mismatch repair protein MLH3
MTRLLKLYLPTLAEQMGEIEALLADPSSAGTGADGWARVQRCMPLEMVELANSRACRGAIMFKDRLDADQCARLIARLAATRNPWICAHGRPTFTPLRVLSAPPPPRTRTIDWAKWK